MAILPTLKNLQYKRTKSADKLAGYILAHTEAIVEMPIAMLAANANVSEPTVNRFCTGLGFKGFPDFKLNLVAELARTAAQFTKNIGRSDSTGQVIVKVFENTHTTLRAVENALDNQVVDTAAGYLLGARAIAICGLGASGPVAMDAHHKLMRFSVPVAVHTDALNQRMIAAGLHANDVLLCLSFTGCTKPMIEVAELGRESGARVIGVTCPDSPLGRLCDLVLPVESGEDTSIYTPMTSRIAQLVIVDVLATRLAMIQGPDFAARLKRTKDSLTAIRLNNT